MNRYSPKYNQASSYSIFSKHWFMEHVLTLQVTKPAETPETFDHEPAETPETYGYGFYILV